MTSDDYHREGLRWLEDHGFDAPDGNTDMWQWFGMWRVANRRVYVVEFELVEVVDSASPAALALRGGNAPGPSQLQRDRHGS